ncbi:MAG: C39 family peptidase [Patescibacteria group bacterium]
MKIKKYIFLLIALTFIFYFPSTSLAAEGSTTLEAPIMNIWIPTLTPLSNIEVVPGQTASIPWIAEYIIAIYRYGLIIAAIFTVIAFMISGLLYITAGGLPQNITKAKSISFGALVGLLLLISSYLILHMINPNLTELKSLTIDTIKGQALPIQLFDEPLVDVPITKGTNNVVMFKQFSGTWGGKVYGYINTPCNCGKKENHGPDWEECQKNSTKCCTSIAQAGCGPTSLAMILATYNANADPGSVSAFVGQKGFGRSCNVGTDLTTAVEKLSQSPWPNFQGKKISKDEALTLLKQNKPIIFHCKECTGTGNSGPKSYSGHYIVLTGIDVNGNVTVNDGGANDSKAIQVITVNQLNNTNGFWYVSPK